MKKTIFKNGKIFYKNKFIKKDILVFDKKILKIQENISDLKATIINIDNCIVTPAFFDSHLHLRIPSKNNNYFTTLEYEQLLIKGGFLYGIAMANTTPPITNIYEYKKINDKLSKLKNVRIFQSLTITNPYKTEKLNNIEKLLNTSSYFSDDGNIIDSKKLFKQMADIDNIKTNTFYFLHSQYNHGDNKYFFKKYFYKEKKNIKNNIKKTKVLIKNMQNKNLFLHFQHLSTKSEVNTFLKYKNKYKNISCEVCPHHLILNKRKLENNGLFKVSPPISSNKNVNYLINQINKNNINIIASDNAPHLNKDKKINYANAKAGFIIHPFMFQILYTYLVKTKKISLEKLILMISINPARYFFQYKLKY